MIKKIIAFSLWGDNPKYTVGAIKNAKLTSEIYPGWISRFYCGQNCYHLIFIYQTRTLVLNLMVDIILSQLKNLEVTKI